MTEGVARNLFRLLKLGIFGRGGGASSLTGERGRETRRPDGVLDLVVLNEEVGRLGGPIGLVALR